MPTPKHRLADRLSRSREIEITVTGRNSGRAISIPVWFVLEDEKLYLLPVRGSDTQWYKNVLENRSLQVDASGEPAALDVDPVTDPARVSAVVEKFRAKYGERDLKRYYSKLDVAVVGELR